MAKASGMVGSEPSQTGANIKPNGPPHAQGKSQPQNSLSPETPTHESLRCPECDSTRLWRDGLRYLADGSTVQRWLCRTCGFRFSEPTADFKVKFNVAGEGAEKPNSGKDFLQADILKGEFSLKPFFENSSFKLGEQVASHTSSKQTITGKALYVFPDYNRKRRVCAQGGCAKNSAPDVGRLMENAVESGKWAAGATTLLSDAKGKLVEFTWWLKKQGYKDSTITSKVKLLRILVQRGGSLEDPESVKEVIAKQNWSEGRKENAVDAYTSYLTFAGGKWDPPSYRRVDKLPFIPTEQELDALIAGCGPKMACFLQLLKDTGMRAGEAWNLKWTDVDFEAGAVRVTPEKGSNPRLLKLSAKCLSMLQALPRKGMLIFGGYPLRGFARGFQRTRKLLAHKLGNPRLFQISFHTFRHWKATMEYAKTKDILHVMKLLGHKNIKNTLVYTQLISFKEDEWICKAARNVEEAKQLIEAGFEYVDTVDGVHLYRKRK